MIVESKEGMKEAAQKILGCLKDRQRSLTIEGSRAQLLLLSGDLGTGKTTLTQEIARLLGIKDRVTSPTFVIQKEYETEDDIFRQLIHIDAYRLESFEDLELLGWSQYAGDSKTLIVIEWPEQVGRESFKHGVEVSLSHVNSGGRKLNYDC